MRKLISSVSPHVNSPLTTQKIMLDVVLALVPAGIAATIIFGWRALLVIGVCVAVCVFSEWGFEKICKKENTISDLSAVVTGMLLAYNLPVSIPLWQAALGSVIAIVVVKQLFGGIGQNFANPAITARIIMMTAFSGTMTTWVFPDAISTATPLAMISKGNLDGLPSYLQMFLGYRGGCLGETCTLALLLGGVYRNCRGYVACLRQGRSVPAYGRRSDDWCALYGDRLFLNSAHKVGQGYLRYRLRSYHRAYPFLGQLPRRCELLHSYYEHSHTVYYKAHAFKAFRSGRW